MTDQPTSERPTDQAGVSIEEAARALGISREAVRLRIRRRTLAAEQHDGVWAVHLAGRSVDPVQRPTRATDRPTDRPAPGARPTDDALVVALVERIQAQEAELAARRREVEELHILLQRAGGRTLGTAPIEPSPPSPQRSTRPTDRPLWKRLVRALREAIATPPG